LGTKPNRDDVRYEEKEYNPQTTFTLESRLNPTSWDHQNIKIVQIGTISPDAIGALYLKAPSLRLATFQEQIEALTYHSVERCTFLTKSIENFGIQSQLIFGNVEDAQLQWAYEHNIHILFPEFWKFEILLAQMNFFRPSHILISDPYEFDSRLVRMFGSLRSKPRILGWAHNRTKEEKDWSEFDLMLASNEVLEKTARLYGARDTMIFLPSYDPFESVEKKNPSIFTIGIFIDSDKLSENTISILQKMYDTFHSEVSDQLASERRCLIKIYPPSNSELPTYLAKLVQPLPYTHDHIQELASSLSAVVYVDNDDNQGTILPKTIFTFALHNIMVFVSSTAQVFEELLPSRELELYTSLSDLINKIDLYRSNENEYQRLIKDARSRALRDHAPEARAYTLLNKLGLLKQAETITEAVITENTTPPEVVSNVAIEQPSIIDEIPLLTEAVDLFTGMEVSKALNLFHQNSVLEALTILDQIISQAVYVPGIHLLRARCIAALEGPTQQWLARNALREELRFAKHKKSNETVIKRTEELLKPIEELDSLRQLPLNEHLFEEWYALVKELTPLPKTTLYCIYRRARLMVVRDVPGDLLDIGCGDGGVSLLLALINKEFSRVPRRVIAIDSFKGISAVNQLDSVEGKSAAQMGWGTGTNVYSQERTLDTFSRAKSNIKLLSVTDIDLNELERVFFSLTDENGVIPFEIALVHIDVSTYNPTRHALEATHQYLNLHGSIVIERGIGLKGVEQAVNEFLSENQGDFRFVGEECDTIWISSKKGYGWTDSRVCTFPEYL